MPTMKIIKANGVQRSEMKRVEKKEKKKVLPQHQLESLVELKAEQPVAVSHSRLQLYHFKTALITRREP